VTRSVPLDLAASPRDNLYAFGKTWGTFGEDPLVSTFHGAMYASVGTSRLQPLFGYAGTGITKVRFVGDGPAERLQMRGKETGFFYDLRTGEVIETWDNPFTGETWRSSPSSTTRSAASSPSRCRSCTSATPRSTASR